MNDEIINKSEPNSEASPSPKDLRAQLAADLKAEFTANLSAVSGLPKVACASLVELLGNSTPTATDVIASLSLEDPKQPEIPDE
jgi:hypothetical protein